MCTQLYSLFIFSLFVNGFVCYLKREYINFRRIHKRLMHFTHHIFGVDENLGQIKRQTQISPACFECQVTRNQMICHTCIAYLPEESARQSFTELIADHLIWQLFWALGSKSSTESHPKAINFCGLIKKAFIRPRHTKISSFKTHECVFCE